MLKLKIPKSLDDMLNRVGGGVMSGAAFAMFRVLVVGSLRQTGERTVCGMLSGSGLGRLVNHKRAHRFFSHTRWCPRQLGCSLADEVISMSQGDGAVEVAFDGSLYRRWGRKVAGCGYYHDPTANAKKRVSAWGNSFVVAAIISTFTFMQRAVALPVLIDMHDKNADDSTSHSQIARDQLDALAARWSDRIVHGVADAEFACTAIMADLPANATFTSRLKINAALFELAPPPLPKRGRGRPARKGKRLAPLTALSDDPATSWRSAIVKRYNKTAQVELHDRTCLWYGVLNNTPVRVILLRDPDATGYQLALVSTDHQATATELIERYARRWSIEVAFQEAKHVAGVGDPRNRNPLAVRRTVPFQLIAMTLTILWYARHLHDPTTIRQQTAESPWYPNKQAPSVRDMYTIGRRILITSELNPTPDHKPTHQQIHQVTRAWELAAA